MHKSIKNARHFQNSFLGKNRNKGAKPSLKHITALMLKKVASLAVYQIAAFAFVRDANFLLTRCDVSSKWKAVVNRLIDEGFHVVTEAQKPHKIEAVSIPPVVRSTVQKSLGYVVLCKFLTFTLSPQATECRVKSTAPQNVVSASKRQPKKAAPKRNEESTGLCRLGVSEAPDTQQVVDDLREAKFAFNSAFNNFGTAMQVFFDSTEGIITAVNRMTASFASKPQGRGELVGEAKMASVASVKRPRSTSAKTASIPKKKAKVDSIQEVEGTNENGPIAFYSDKSTWPLEEKRTVAKKKPKSVPISAVSYGEVAQRAREQHKSFDFMSWGGY